VIEIRVSMAIGLVAQFWDYSARYRLVCMDLGPIAP